MATMLYRFDNVDAFPWLPTQSTATGRGGLRAERDGEGAFLHVSLNRKISAAAEAAGEGVADGVGEAAAEAAIVLGLPLIAVDGTPEALELDVRGDAGGCHLMAEAGDAWGWGFAYSFGRIDFSDWRTCRADVQRPSEFWGERKDRDTSRIVPPVQLFRLRLVLPEACRVLDVGLRTLTVTGRVRLASPGLAGDACG